MYLRMTTVYDNCFVYWELTKRIDLRYSHHTHTQMVTMWRNGYIN